MDTLVYAVLGQIGAGKTTYGRELAEKKNAVFFSMDQTLAKLGVHINSYADYEKLYPGVNAIIKDLAVQIIRKGIPVVFDYGVNRQKGRLALKKLAEVEGASLELHHLIVPTDIRRERVRKRNTLKPYGIFSFNISDEEFDFISTVYAPPTDDEGIPVISHEWSDE